MQSQVCITQYGDKQVIEIVGDTSCELSNGVDFLSCLKLCFKCLSFFFKDSTTSDIPNNTGLVVEAIEFVAGK